MAPKSAGSFGAYNQNERATAPQAGQEWMAPADHPPGATQPTPGQATGVPPRQQTGAGQVPPRPQTGGDPLPPRQQTGAGPLPPRQQTGGYVPPRLRPTGGGTPGANVNPGTAITALGVGSALPGTPTAAEPPAVQFGRSAPADDAARQQEEQERKQARVDAWLGGKGSLPFYGPVQADLSPPAMTPPSSTPNTDKFFELKAQMQRVEDQLKALYSSFSTSCVGCGAFQSMLGSNNYMFQARPSEQSQGPIKSYSAEDRRQIDRLSGQLADMATYMRWLAEQRKNSNENKWDSKQYQKAVQEGGTSKENRQLNIPLPLYPEIP